MIERSHACRLVLSVGLVAACASHPARDLEQAQTHGVEVLVIGPHPDDEALLAAGVMQSAVARGERVAVIIVTNGDLSCERDGYVRGAESINALRLIGVHERDVHFLGYPDGDLAKLGPVPLALLERRNKQGQCIKAAWTYAGRGADEHTARTGRPAEYTSVALRDDLAALLLRLRPRDIYITHGIDEHPDHAATYAFFRRALDRIDVPAPRVHRGVIHAGQCWPGECGVPFDPGGFVPRLPPPLERYEPRERLPVDAEFKRDVIAQYPSQTGPVPRADWLFSFARREETFYPEQLVRTPSGKWLRAAAPGQTAVELTLSFEHFPLLRLTAARDQGLDELELFVSHDSITFNQVEGWSRRRLAMWPRPPTE